MRMAAADDPPELSRVRSSDFLGWEGVFGEVEFGGGEAGMEKPTTEDAGRLEGPGLRRREAHDTAGFGVGAGAGAGADVEASAFGAAAGSASDGMEAEGSTSDKEGAAADVEGSGSGLGASTGLSHNISAGSGSSGDDEASTEGFSSGCSGAFAREKDVLVEAGEPGTGVSNAVESGGVVFDSVLSGRSEGAGADRSKTTGVGDGGGVGMSSAY